MVGCGCIAMSMAEAIIEQYNAEARELDRHLIAELDRYTESRLPWLAFGSSPAVSWTHGSSQVSTLIPRYDILTGTTRGYDEVFLGGLKACGLNAARDVATAEVEVAGKRGSGGPATTSSSATEHMREEKLGANSIDTSGWLAEIDRAPAVKGLGRGVWCETSKPSESPAPVDAKVEDAKVEDTTDVVSFANIFSAGRFDGTTLDDFLENDEAGGDDEVAGGDIRDAGEVAGPSNASAIDLPIGTYANDDRLDTLMEELDNVDDFDQQVKRAKATKDEVWAVRQQFDDIDKEFADAVPDPALSFPFSLDTFQMQSIIHMERNESVFVAAHTSAGKTVVAEYAFALAARHCSRAVYTSPIKTISNQKFRDFTDSGFDVGLITGDVSIKPEASSLIMTTEILRSMLYRGASIIRDIEWVIFDEVHYINDAERGVVWEEAIIMLPPEVSIVCLSATVPNVLEFANWVGRIKKRKIYITGTTKRPVPLEHFLYHHGETFKVCEAKNFLPLGYKQASDFHKQRNAPKVVPQKAAKGGQQAKAGKQGGARNQPQQRRPTQQRGPKTTGPGGERTQLNKLLATLKSKELLPAIVFAFSKKRCDTLADFIRSSDLTSAKEKHEILVFCAFAFSRLAVNDRKLPQIIRVQQLLSRGIGVHHAGLLPIVREVVEMLFCKSYIKILFSTETFAMGVNAPARAVVFHSLRKHDGQGFRTLLPGEYTQMAGRAGRRGLDRFGTVIMACWDNLPGELELRKLLTGSATKLQSQFRLTYNMILNLLRVDELKVEDMIRRSFAEFNAQSAHPSQQALLKRASMASNTLETIQWPVDRDQCSEETVSEYAICVERASTASKTIMTRVNEGHLLSSILTPGRAVLYYESADGDLPQVGILCHVKSNKLRVGALGKAPKKVVLMILHHPSMPVADAIARLESSKDKIDKMKLDAASTEFGSLKMKHGRLPSKSNGAMLDHRLPDLPITDKCEGHLWSLIETDASNILGVMRDRAVGLEPAQIFSCQTKDVCDAVAFMQGVYEEFVGKQSLLVSAKNDMKLQSMDDIQLYMNLQQNIERVQSLACNTSTKLMEQFRIVKAKFKIADRMSELRFKLSDASLQQMPEFHQRVAVMQSLEYVDNLQIVKIKGRVACEIQSCDELVATEMVFRGMLTSLSPAEAIALVSSLVFQDKTYGEADVPDSLKEKSEDLTALVLELGELQCRCGMSIPSEDYLKSCVNFGLLQVVYEWANGMPFSQICEHTDVMEGSIVRTIVRLEETCREFRDAARVMGDPRLLTLMEKCSFLIKRDVIFAASLYVT